MSKDSMELPKDLVKEIEADAYHYADNSADLYGTTPQACAIGYFAGSKSMYQKLQSQILDYRKALEEIILAKEILDRIYAEGVFMGADWSNAENNFKLPFGKGKLRLDKYTSTK